jgi:predicted GNAT family N-acyltransferase
MMTWSFNVRHAPWPLDAPALQAIRHEVFVREQQVPIELEWDGLDAECRHFLAEDGGGTAIGCARLLPDGHIGRMAVLAAWRRHGVGRALLQAAIAAGRAAGQGELLLNAQTHALAFYERAGFVACGPVFDDAGIEHRAMRLDCRA